MGAQEPCGPTAGRARPVRQGIATDVTVQTKGADAELGLAVGDPERRLVLVLLPDSVGQRKVHLGKEARAARLVDELVDVRQRLQRLLRDGLSP